MSSLLRMALAAKVVAAKQGSDPTRRIENANANDGSVEGIGQTRARMPDIIRSPPIPATASHIKTAPPELRPFSPRIIAFDTETSGLNFFRERVIDTALVEVVDGLPTGRKFSSQVRSLHPINAEATSIHGVRNKDLVNAPTWGEILPKMLAFIDGAPVVAHNAEFDAGFWAAECYRILELAGRVAPLTHENGELVFRGFLPAQDVIDMIDPNSHGYVPITFECSLKFYRGRFPGAASLNKMSERFGIDTSDRSGAGSHGALKDAELLATNILGLRRSQLSLTLGREADLGDVAKIVDRPFRPARSFPLSPDEVSAHRLCVAKLKSAIWLRHPAYAADEVGDAPASPHPSPSPEKTNIAEPSFAL